MKQNRFSVTIFVIVLFGLFSYPTQAGFQDFVKDALNAIKGSERLSHDEIVQGLKQALEIGTANAVKTVSAANGYYKNPDIKIPLPEDVRKAEKYIRAAGFGNKVDEFELSMNRAAEKAAPEAKAIFVDAIKQMSFDDARKILDGADDAATVYFKDKTSDRLTRIFKPIVNQSMSEVGATQVYQNLNNRVKKIPFVDSFSLDLDQYVTDQALSGLFVMLAREEKMIRENPAARVTELLQKVFGSN
jgi:hypothetical protein